MINETETDLYAIECIIDSLMFAGNLEDEIRFNELVDHLRLIQSTANDEDAVKCARFALGIIDTGLSMRGFDNMGQVMVMIRSCVLTGLAGKGRFGDR